MIDDLYDLIGGAQTVRAAAEAFYRRIFADETLNRFFKTTDLATMLSAKHVYFNAFRANREQMLNKEGENDSSGLVATS